MRMQNYKYIHACEEHSVRPSASARQQSQLCLREILYLVHVDLVYDVLREAASGIRVELQRSRVEIVHDIARVEQRIVLAVLPIVLKPAIREWITFTSTPVHINAKIIA